MPARHAVARRIESALGPVYQRQECDLLLVQELEDVLARVFAVEAAPGARPVVIWIVIGDAWPVAPGQFRVILDLQLPLVRCPDHVDAAEGFLGEAAEFLAAV